MLGSYTKLVQYKVTIRSILKATWAGRRGMPYHCAKVAHIWLSKILQPADTALQTIRRYDGNARAVKHFRRLLDLGEQDGSITQS